MFFSYFEPTRRHCSDPSVCFSRMRHGGTGVDLCGFFTRHDEVEVQSMPF